MRKTSNVKNGIASFFKYFFMIFLIFISLAPIMKYFMNSVIIVGNQCSCYGGSGCNVCLCNFQI